MEQEEGESVDRGLPQDARRGEANHTERNSQDGSAAGMQNQARGRRVETADIDALQEFRGEDDSQELHQRDVCCFDTEWPAGRDALEHYAHIFEEERQRGPLATAGPGGADLRV